MMDGDGYNRDGYGREGAGWEDRDDPYYRPSRELDPHESTSGHERHELTTVDSEAVETGGGVRGRPKRKNMPLWQELPLLLVVAFCLAVLIRTFLLQAFYIPSTSMENTLQVGDRVLVNKVIYDMRTPARGEVVVFRGTDKWLPENQPDPNIGFFSELGRTLGDLVGMTRPGEKDFIKRVIGLPGDVVACCDVNGRLTVNGYPLNEPYVTNNAPLIDQQTGPRDCQSRKFDPVTVEPGQMFVMGDNRLVSRDSRCQGQVPIENVIGRAFVVLWPSSRWESLSVPSTFGNVPKPFAAGPSLTPPATAPTPGMAWLIVFFASWPKMRRSGRSILGVAS